MQILVTGATGFLGGRIARQLVAEGHTVRALVRGTTPGRVPAEVESVAGDVTDAAGFEQAAVGCDVILHAAAMVKIWAPDSKAVERVNVGGLRNAARAARATGARLVYTSSFIALGPTDGTILDESSPRASERFHNDYERTKTLADREARRMASEGVPVVRLYPGVIFGPGALTQGNHVVALLLQHARGELPGMLGRGDLRQCFAFVDDVVAGAVAAIERAAPGSAYVLGGENKTAIELFDAFERAAGVAPPRRKIPFAAAWVIGWFQRQRANLFGTEPELTDEVVGIYTHEWAYSSARAEAELGYRITPFDSAIQQTVDWLRETGQLPRADS